MRTKTMCATLISVLVLFLFASSVYAQGTESSSLLQNMNITSAKSVVLQSASTSRVVAKKVKLNVSKKLVGVGNKFTLKATVTPSDTSNKKVKWTSSNTKVATVNQDGVVQTWKRGNAKITATAVGNSSAKATALITVKSDFVTTKKITDVYKSATGKAIASVPKGIEVERLQFYKNGWSKIRYQEKTFFVKSNCLGSNKGNIQYTMIQSKNKTNITEAKKKLDKAPTIVRNYVSKNQIPIYISDVNLKRVWGGDGEYTGMTTDNVVALGARDSFPAYYSILHEVGHVWDKSYMATGTFSSSPEFMQIYKAEKNLFKDAYYRNSSSEFFAESFEMYCLEPAKLKKGAPKTYAFINKTIKNRKAFGAYRYCNNSCIVLANANGGIISNSPNERLFVDSSRTITIPKYKISRKGSTFKGWQYVWTNLNGTKRKSGTVKAGGKITLPYLTELSTLSLTAMWDDSANIDYSGEHHEQHDGFDVTYTVP